jgi:orotate phosphoribosyltransferase
MQTEDPRTLLSLLPTRRGHFLLESGLHTDRWIDFEPLFVNQAVLAPHISQLAALLATHSPTAICGPFVGGAFLAQLLAAEMQLKFFFAEKVSARGDKLFSARYALPAAIAREVRGERVVVVDEAISAGSSVRATIHDLETHHSTVAAVGTLVSLGTVGAAHFKSVGLPFYALAHDTLTTWMPTACPRCAEGMPLDRRDD